MIRISSRVGVRVRVNIRARARASVRVLAAVGLHRKLRPILRQRAYNMVA